MKFCGANLGSKRLRCRSFAQWMTVICVVCIWAGGAIAQEYRFEIPEMKMGVSVQPDASVRLEYTMVFQNRRGAHPIDIVDVGLPHSGYQIANMEASVDGQPVRKIRRSEYINIGVECHLGSGTIPAGARGTFRFSCVIPNMVYQDTTDAEYASLQIRPTWFDRQFHKGTTNLEVALHVLPGIEAEEVRYQQEKQRYSQLYNFGEGDEKHAVAYWQSEQHTLSGDNPKFSISFPRRAMQRVVEKSKLELLLDWFDASPQLKVISGAALVMMFMVGYYRFAGVTGCVPFLLLLVMLGLAIVSGPGPHLLCWPLGISMFGLNEWFRSMRKDDGYLPAMATVEGGGIKRGLTAPQAAVLLEQPLGRILTMIIFGMLKKDLVTMVSEAPISVEVNKKYRCPRKERRKQAAKTGVVLHDYDQAFLDILQTHQGPVEKCDLNSAMGGLVKSVGERMKGFDLERTREYYRRIVKRAWKDAGSIGEIQQRDQIVERNFEWMMMDPDWTDLFDVWRRRGYTYRPRWSRPRRYPTTGSFPSGGGSPSAVPSGGGAPRTTGGGGDGSAPTLGEVAGSFVGWAENTAGNLAGSLEPGSMGLNLPSGVVDLSGVDRITGDFFEALAEASKSSGGGGGGGGCACACAGCACACACAGGGR